MNVHEVMTKNVIAVEPETPLKKVAELLVEHGISGLPVVDAEGVVLGVVSEADFLAKAPTPKKSRLLAWLLDDADLWRDKLTARTSGEAMTAPAVTIGPDRDIAEAARLMSRHDVNRLPVVDDQGKLVGIVTRADLVRTFTRPDEEIKQSLERLARETLWIADEGLSIEVSQGEVQLSGELGRRSDAELLVRFARREPGVVAVSSALRWRWDDRKVAPERSDPRIPTAPRP